MNRLFFNLDAESPESSLVDSVESNISKDLPPFVRGYSLDTQLHFLRRSPEGSELPFRFVDPTGWAVTVAVGEVGAEPTGGSWTFTSAAQTTAAISWDASAAAVQAAIRAACTTNFLTCVVTGDAGGPYVIDRGVTGSVATPSANDDLLLPPSSKVSITPSQAGTVSFNAQFFVELTRAVPIGRSSGWVALAAALVTPAVLQAGSGSANKVFSLDWNADAYAGDVTVAFTGNSVTEGVGPIAFNASAEDVATAFAEHTDAADNEIQVVKNGPGSYSITCTGPDLGLSNTPALAIRSDTLKVPVGLSGILNANTPGVLDLLGDEEEVEATFEVRVDMGDGPQCICQISDARILATILGDFVGVSNPIDPPMTEAAAEATWPILAGDADELISGTVSFAVLPAPLNETDPSLAQYHYTLPLWVQDSIDVAARTPLHIGSLLYDQEAGIFYVADGVTPGDWGGAFRTTTLVAESLNLSADGTNFASLSAQAGVAPDIILPAVSGTLALDELPSYTVGTVPSAAANTRKSIWVSNESGGAQPAYSNGTNWRRYSDGNIIS